MVATDPRFGFKIDKGLSQSYTLRWLVASGSTNSILTGAPAKIVTADGSVAGVAISMVDGDGIVTGQRFVGLAKDTSTDTSAVAGVVNTWAPVPDLLYRGTAKSSTAANTQAKIDALMGKKVLFDRTADTQAGTWTVDTAATDALVNCVVIVGGNPLTNEVSFIYSLKGTVFNTATPI